MTNDEARMAEVEARVLETFKDGGMGVISKADFEFICNSRSAWRATAKLYASEAGEKPTW